MEKSVGTAEKVTIYCFVEEISFCVSNRGRRVYSLQFKLTPEAEKLHLEVLKVRNETEDLLVIKLRKLLMMSIKKRILL